MLDQVFANLATGFAAQFGAPFEDATARWPGTPVKDAGGSITTPGTPVTLSCKVQFDAPTREMRAAEGFRETDARAIVLAASLAGILDAKARLVVDSGVNAGTWELNSVVRDPTIINWRRWQSALFAGYRLTVKCENCPDAHSFPYYPDHHLMVAGVEPRGTGEWSILILSEFA